MPRVAKNRTMGTVSMNHKRTRKNLLPSRLRLCVHRSAKHIYAQIIDDIKGITLCAASSLNLQEGTRADAGMTRKVYIADQVGRQIAEKAKEKGVTKVFSTEMVTNIMAELSSWLNQLDEKD